MIKLNQLQVGERAILKKIEDNLEIKKRLLDIGFTKESPIECLMKSAFHGPTAYKIKNTVIALRDADSEKIDVEVLS